MPYNRHSRKGISDANIMNRFCAYVILVGLLISLIFPASSSAQPLPPESENLVSFTRLGAAEQNLRGPFDAAHLDFSLPATWELTDDLALQLNLTTFFAGQATADQAETAARQFGGTLQVVVNGVTVQTILLDQLGERVVEVPLPREALAAATSDGRQRLSLLLDTDEQCGLEQYTSVIVRASSQLILPHRVVAPPTDLALLPQPIVQRSFTPDAATIVVPDRPTAGELQAALSIAAGFGSMTDSTFQLDLLPVSQVDETTRKSRHLILVGRSETLPFFNRGGLPGRNEPVAPDDGMIQMAVSPWNPALVVLVASGQSDAAVIKAAQAISTGAIRGGDQPDRALVAAIQPEESAAASSVDRTFADLGYDVQQMYGQGAQYAAYQFELPAAQVITDEAYLDLAFVHTALLDYDQSGMTVTLNDEPIASVRLDDTSTRLSSTRIALPSSALRAGSNTLVVRGDLLPRAVCTDPRGNGLWLAIRPESSLHLPLGSSPEAPAQALDLKRYPQPLTISPSLQRLAFVLAADDPQSWAVAAGIALDLGRQTHAALAEPLVVYGDSVPEPVRSSRDLVIVGRPSKLPILSEIKQALPAPFESGSDLAAEPGAPVQLRRASGESVGYVQLLAAPWDEQRAVLAVLGSTEQGLEWAGVALTTPRLRSRLSGNLAIVYEEQITSSDTRPQQETAEQPAAVAEAEPVAAPTPSRAILLAAAAIGGLLLALLVALAVWWRRRKVRRVARTSAT